MLQPARVFAGDPATANDKVDQHDPLNIMAYVAKNENVDYAEGDHKPIFFTNKIEKTASMFSWEQALNKLRSHPVQGKNCQVFQRRYVMFVGVFRHDLCC